MIFDLNVPHIWKLIFDNLRTKELCNLCKADARFIPAVEEYFYSETKDEEEKDAIPRRVASLSEFEFERLGFYCTFPDWRTQPSELESSQEQWRIWQMDWDNHWQRFQMIDDYLYGDAKK